MTTITVPIDDQLNEFIKEMIENDNAETKAGVVRMALRKLREDQLFKEIVLARESVRKDGVFSGDLDELVDKI